MCNNLQFDLIKMRENIFLEILLFGVSFQFLHLRLRAARAWNIGLEEGKYEMQQRFFEFTTFILFRFIFFISISI